MTPSLRLLKPADSTEETDKELTFSTSPMHLMIQVLQEKEETMVIKLLKTMEISFSGISEAPLIFIAVLTLS